MKKFAASFTLILGLLVAACDTAGPTQVTSSLDGTLEATQAMGNLSIADDTINADLAAIARVLSYAVADPVVRRAIYQGVSIRFNGAPEILLSELNQNTAFAGSVRNAISRRQLSEIGVTLQSFAGILAKYPSLHVAVPVRLNEWTGAAYVPIVAVAHRGGDEFGPVQAYQAGGQSVILSGSEAPTRPVIVVGLNERTDVQGRLLERYAAVRLEGYTARLEVPAFGTFAADTSDGGDPGGGTGNSYRSSPHAEKLELVYVQNDHEAWYMEPAEINYHAVCSNGIEAQDFLGDPEPEDTWLYAGLNSAGEYTYKSFTYQLSSVGIDQYTWYAPTPGAFCGWSWWEDDGGGSTTVSTTITNPDTHQSFTFSDTRPVVRDEMGTRPVLFSDPLTKDYQTNDIRWNMK